VFSLMVEASGAAGAFVCGGAIEWAAVGLVSRISRFAGGLPDFAFAIVALTWAVVTFSPRQIRKICGFAELVTAHEIQSCVIGPAEFLPTRQ
jgi:hypothetical protein